MEAFPFGLSRDRLRDRCLNAVRQRHSRSTKVSAIPTFNRFMSALREHRVVSGVQYLKGITNERGNVDDVRR